MLQHWKVQSLQLKSSAVYVLPPLFLLMANVRRLGASSGPMGPGRHLCPEECYRYWLIDGTKMHSLWVRMPWHPVQVLLNFKIHLILEKNKYILYIYICILVYSITSDRMSCFEKYPSNLPRIHVYQLKKKTELAPVSHHFQVDISTWFRLFDKHFNLPHVYSLFLFV